MIACARRIRVAAAGPLTTAIAAGGPAKAATVATALALATIAAVATAAPAATAAAGATAEAATATAAIATATAPAAGLADRTILFFGDSLTAGLGVPPSAAFPALIQSRIDELDWDFEVVQAGVSGETSAGGLRRIDWVLRRNAAVVILELGANDGLRGVPTEATAANLQAIIDRTRASDPDTVIVLAGMRVPPNLGLDYARRFADMFTTLAERNELALIPFLLEGVGGRPELNLADGIHPNEAGHRLVADTVWETLEPVLRELR